MSRLVVVSNRIRTPGRSPAPGGVAAGLTATMRAHPGLWFGWDGEVCTEDAVEILHADNVTYASISYSADEYRDFYLGFCNSTLWPLLHGFGERVRYREEEFSAYLHMNRRYAVELAPLLRSDDLIWIHDYHLLPLARHLRERGCAQPVGLFVHTPFPPAEVLRVMPQADDLLHLMCDYDLVGFQTQTDVQVFERALAAMGGEVSTGVFPIGVDVDGIQRQAARSPDPRTGVVVLGIDRLDYTKGLVERVRAFDRLMATDPDLHGRVSYLQIAAPTRTELPDYRDLRRQLREAVAVTNTRFARGDWTPIRYLERVVPKDVLLGLMRSAQVGLVTPLVDGMNLVAKEFVAAQDPADPGVLVLSKAAGAADELSSALLVDPLDVPAAAAALGRALRMPLAERQERHQAMLRVLHRNSIDGWHARFIAALQREVMGASPENGLPPRDRAGQVADMQENSWPAAPFQAVIGRGS